MEIEKDNLVISYQEEGFEWIDYTPSDEIRDLLCVKCDEITEHEVNPYSAIHSHQTVFGWICQDCGECTEILEEEDYPDIVRFNEIGGKFKNVKDE